MYATRHGFQDVVGVLLRHGVDVNGATKSGWTPLFFAIRWSQLDIMKTLLKAGVVVDIKDKVGVCGVCVCGVDVCERGGGGGRTYVCNAA
jgi:ankyrin repeat protein